MYSLIAPSNRNITLPPDAGPGQARIVIGPDLPVPLDTYTFTEEFNGGTFKYSSAMIFYPVSVAPNVDKAYTYIASVAETAGPGTMIWHVGTVVNNLVVESSPSFPEVLQFSESITGTAADGRIIAGGKLLMHAFTAGVSSFVATAAGDMNLQAAANWLASGTTSAQVTGDSGNQILSLTSGGASLTASAANKDVILSANRNVRITSPIDWAGAVAVRDFKSTTVTTTSVPFVLSATVCGVSFVAPPSGKVQITWRAQLSNNTAAGFTYCSPGITEGSTPGSGTVFLAPAVTMGVAVVNVTPEEFGSSDLITGLTAGATYSIALWQRSSAVGNTATALNRGCTVNPAL